MPISWSSYSPTLPDLLDLTRPDERIAGVRVVRRIGGILDDPD